MQRGTLSIGVTRTMKNGSHVSHSARCSSQSTLEPAPQIASHHLSSQTCRHNYRQVEGVWRRFKRGGTWALRHRAAGNVSGPARTWRVIGRRWLCPARAS